MWGKHVENEIRESTKGAKNEREAEQKATRTIMRLMTPKPEAKLSDEDKAAQPIPRGVYRDPFAHMKKE